ncbi:hypothetical protein XMM379_001246 [Aliiroseovarius sp. xm-m-379]|jgi:hypothetical protein|uniref:hypothetical protein n=1 Tax=unclassified Aliiroseovarius TaxID=2623558 RepID=UPI00156A2C65|nr:MULTISPECIES: hypothetical protein [unclassified Aliiroseovarius]NRP24562.1 hypothetical protein [Aliiroseovarius sp. xm-m-379]NRP33361.1 hypothetical protein [Aliiroseovarius sp. xm-a-104]NRQ20481.1 hypothetical protein [Aliiroseovarius sp. xm-v-204]
MAFPKNTPSVDDMLNMPVTELALMPPSLLAAVQAEIDVATDRIKAVTERFALALEVRYSTRASECRHHEGKDTGTIRFEDDGVTVIAELPKRIDWDQAKLAQIAVNIASAGEDPSEFIDTKLSVSERKYGALPESWRKGFEPARTVRTGKPKFRLVLNEGAN